MYANSKVRGIEKTVYALFLKMSVLHACSHLILSSTVRSVILCFRSPKNSGFLSLE